MGRLVTGFLGREKVEYAWGGTKKPAGMRVIESTLIWDRLLWWGDEGFAEIGIVEGVGHDEFVLAEELA